MNKWFQWSFLVWSEAWDNSPEGKHFGCMKETAVIKTGHFVQDQIKMWDERPINTRDLKKEKLP